MKALILVVDDNAANLKLAADVLEADGFEVLCADGASQALEILARTRPDLVLLDLSMPGMDGLTLTRRLRAEEATRDLRIVALTASAMRGDEVRVMEAGCNGYITKPIDTRALGRQVLKYLAPRQASGGRVVLVVDDNATNRRLLRATLESDGMQVLEAHDGVEALELLQNQSVDVVITDVLMPRMDGYRFCLELRRDERFRKLPLIIYTSTYTTAEDERLALNMGADRYLVKPAPTHVLLEAVRKLGPHHGNGGSLDPRSQRELMVLEQYSQQLVGKLEQRNAELARTTAELETAHERLRLLMANSPAVTWSLSVDGRRIALHVVSGHVSNLLGYSLAEPLSYEWWLDHVHPEDRPRAVAALDDTLPLGTFQLDYRLRHRDGGYRWVSDNRRLVRGGAEGPTEIVGVWTDISDRKRGEEALRESEQKFRQLAENIQEVFWIRSLEGLRFVYLSPAFEATWGLDAATFYSDPQAWAKAILPEDRDAVAAGLARLADGAPEVTLTYRVRRPDGSVRWLLDRGFPIRDDTGLFYRIAGVAKDVTEQRRLEEALRQTQKIEAIGQLAGGIAHDFNNILGCIIGNAELLETDVGEDEGARECVREVLKASQRAKDLVRQILTFSRRHEQERKPVDLVALVAESLRLLRASLPSTIDIRADLPEGLPAILADPTQVQQVVLNLGTNADYAMEGRGRLSVSVSRLEIEEQQAQVGELAPGSYLRLTVSDTGCGMAPDVMERVFEPFFTTKAQGTGLGLAVVHGIIRSHEGAIAVQSEPGRGSTFTVDFPVHHGATPKAEDGPGVARRGAGEHILLVDDEPQLAALGRTILERAGYRVTARTSSPEALASFREAPHSYDLLVADLTMPSLTGAELTAEVLALRPELPVILATGFGGKLTPRRAQELGVREVLMKPLTSDVLTSAVWRALHPSGKA